MEEIDEIDEIEEIAEEIEEDCRIAEEIKRQKR